MTHEDMILGSTWNNGWGFFVVQLNLVASSRIALLSGSSAFISMNPLSYHSVPFCGRFNMSEDQREGHFPSVLLEPLKKT